MICIPITGNTQEEALLQIEMGLPRAHVLELRMDMISGDLQRLMERCRSHSIPVKILVTNRRREPSSLGESVEEERRIAVLEEAIRLGADYVDIELDTAEPLRRDVLVMARNHGKRTTVIISHHDFMKTPSFRTLKDI